MIEINLLPEELKVKAKTKPKLKKPEIEIKPAKFLYAIPVLVAILILAHLYLAVTVVSENNQYHSLNAKWLKLEPQRNMLEIYNKENASISENAKLMRQLIDKRINWAEKLNKLSLHLPSGIWFDEISASNKELVIRASVVSLQKDDMSLIAKLMGNLKNDPGFLNGFVNLELGAIQHKTIESFDVADFTLTATLKGK